MDLAQASFGSAKNTVHRDFKKAQTAFFRDSKPVNLSVIGTYPVPAWAARRYARLGPHSRRAGIKRGQDKDCRNRRPELFRVHDKKAQGKLEGDTIGPLCNNPRP